MSSTKGARITGEERQQLMLSYVRRYRAGESIRSLAAETGRSYGFVQGLLKEAGVPLRARGGATRGAEAEADRKERQARVEAVRAAERADDTAEPVAASPVEDAELAAPEAYVERATDVVPGSAVVQADTEVRDLHRSPTSPADWGLPTPPLGVLVPKKDKGKKKAKKIAAKKANGGGGPRHVRELVAASHAATRVADEVPPSAEEKDARGKKGSAKKDKGKGKGKGKGKKGKGRNDEPAEGGVPGQGRSQKPTS